MTDRKLLEDAAKAAGMNVGGAQNGVWFYCEHGGSGSGIYKVSGNIYEYWSALADDGDALRLAVKLELWEAVRDGYQHFDSSGDIYEATRRAIVRAAAAMVKP
jgi:hypothetical protein